MAENKQEMELLKFEFQGDGDKNLKNWKKIEQIGIGGYSNVYRAKAFTTNAKREIAAKEINLTKDINKKASKTATTEINALLKLSHERIVSYFGFCQQDFAYFIFIEYMPLGSLCGYIRDKEFKREDRVQLFTKQLLEGIQYLHTQRVLHRDIKTGNILMSSRKSIKLTDFGLSKIFDEFSKASTTGVGTIRYMAPEMYSGSYSYPVDIWAVGCVVVEMLTGDFPFSNLEGQQVMFALFKENTSPLKYIDQKLPDLAEQFLNKIFKYKPEERHLAKDLLTNDPYITGDKKVFCLTGIDGRIHNFSYKVSNTNSELDLTWTLDLDVIRRQYMLIEEENSLLHANCEDIVEKLRFREASLALSIVALVESIVITLYILILYYMKD